MPVPHSPQVCVFACGNMSTRDSEIPQQSRYVHFQLHMHLHTHTQAHCTCTVAHACFNAHAHAHLHHSLPVLDRSLQHQEHIYLAYVHTHARTLADSLSLSLFVCAGLEVVSLVAWHLPPDQTPPPLLLARVLAVSLCLIRPHQVLWTLWVCCCSTWVVQTRWTMCSRSCTTCLLIQRSSGVCDMGRTFLPNLFAAQREAAMCLSYAPFTHVIRCIRSAMSSA